MRRARILMCPPDYYGIEYEINPWMSRMHGSTPERARRQWQNLHDTLCGLGVQVETMAPQPGRLVEVLKVPRPEEQPEQSRRKPWFVNFCQMLLRRLEEESPAPSGTKV